MLLKYWRRIRITSMAGFNSVHLAYLDGLDLQFKRGVLVDDNHGTRMHLEA